MACCGGCCCGGVKPANIEDENVINVFKQVVAEKNAGEFVKIVSATQQVVAGFIFEGVVEVKEGDANVQYKVKVWCKPGTQGNEIQLFEKA